MSRISAIALLFALVFTGSVGAQPPSTVPPAPPDLKTDQWWAWGTGPLLTPGSGTEAWRSASTSDKPAGMKFNEKRTRRIQPPGYGPNGTEDIHEISFEISTGPTWKPECPKPPCSCLKVKCVAPDGSYVLLTNGEKYYRQGNFPVSYRPVYNTYVMYDGYPYYYGRYGYGF